MKLTCFRRVSISILGVFLALLLGSHSVLATVMAKQHGVTVLTNADFRYGTYIIDKPGKYRLGEDVSFNPNSPETLSLAVKDGIIPPELASRLGLSADVDAYSAGMPLFTQFTRGETPPFTPGGPLDRRYDPAAFGLGFFAAIVIMADNVVLDLNGYTIEQHQEHALLQRFFSVIELAEQPFIPNQGPADFGASIISASNVVIKNGTIGRSAHHGIHGNGNRHIRLLNVDFVDYEVAAMALNGVEGLLVKDVYASNRKDVPVLGTFSSAQFIKPYIEALVRNGSMTRLKVNGKSFYVHDIRKALRKSINAVHGDIIQGSPANEGRAVIDATRHPLEFALFHNPTGLIDGNSYSFLLNKMGVAVNGFPHAPGPDERGAKNVWFSNVHVNGQHAFVNEIIALSNEGKAVIDPVGAVFQVFNRHPETGQPVTISDLDMAQARYHGNVVANAQAFVAKAFLNGDFDGSPLDLSRLNINKKILSWIEAKPGFEMLSSIVASEGGLLCNGDSMFHVNKGVIAFKMDASRNVVLRNTSANDVVNLGAVGSSLCGDYSQSRSHPDATLNGYGGAKTRGYTFAGSRNVLANKLVASGLAAGEGSAFGIDIMTDSRYVMVHDAFIQDVSAGLAGPGTYQGPNEVPLAIGFNIGKSTANTAIIRACAELLEGFAGALILSDKSEEAFLRTICRD